MPQKFTVQCKSLYLSLYIDELSDEGHHWPLAGDNPGLVAYQTIQMSSLRCYAMTILWKLKITNP